MKNKPDFAYHTVYRYLVGLINDAPGGPPTRLPSLRQLAVRLKVSISTVQNAYSLLEKEGRVCSVPKSGYFAQPNGRSDCTPDSSEESKGLLEALYNSARRPGMLVLGNDQPTQAESLESPLLLIERELVRQYPGPLDPNFQPFGDVELRSALAAHYTVSTQRSWLPEDAFVGPDLLAMMKVVLETLALRGSTVLVESPCTWTLLRLLQSFNIRVIELPVDQAGCINIPALDQILLNEGVGLALLPSFLNAVRGSGLPAHNRQAVADLLNRYRVWVLENDSHGELSFEAPLCRLRDLIDPERLLIIGSFEKILGAEAPYGYLLSRSFHPQWQQYFLLQAFNLPPLRQKAIARLYSSGRLDQHLGELRRVLEQRMLAMTSLIDQHLGRLLHYETPQGGAVIWAQSAYCVDMRQVFDQLLQERIVIAPGELFSLQGLHRQNLRISYAIGEHLPIETTLATLRRALSEARCA
ncbi:regulatory protein, GntR [Pseudomonas sp. CFII64]|uniref:aminotransferase-like domain-containing protein n=1 Tax=Pseudomonas sp. CFII64 TaxID=911242 RepID=UPI0003573F6F|nr:PLP-dependent aminotransferase family protein [Pseudomonas sp. CFII64]EPJ84816.1 regulatory protein, GntR [Pseudomonas sp. CFII64]